jgi:hypothetical protein
MSNRYRRLTELFVQGQAVAMPDGGYLWVQVINSFEREECLSDAQVARARLILALNEMGDERIKVEARLSEVGHDVMARDLAEARASAKTTDFADAMREDPEWKERMNIALRTNFDEAAKPPTDEENLLMAKINNEIMGEFMHRQEEEKEFLRRRYERMDISEFIDEWVDEWIERKGSALATQEFRLTELWYAARFCEARPNEDGVLDHTRCEGHRESVFESKTETRSAPSALQQLLRDALDELNLAGRDPKDSDSPENSSDSSPTPNEAAESTASTSTETPSSPPGTSVPQSAMR